MTTTQLQLKKNAAHTAHSFWWADLETDDVDTAKKFYSQLLGWEYEGDSVPNGGMYFMAGDGELTTSGLYEGSREREGRQSQWLSYVTVSDLDATITRVKQVGGTVVTEPMDVMSSGRMATITDPSGAILNLWQAKKSRGADAVNQPGALSWNEIMTDDPESASEFLTTLLGWSVREDTLADDRKYWVFSFDSRPVAGMIERTTEMGPFPNRWIPYFGVPSVDQSVEQIKALDGRIGLEPTDIEWGRIAHAIDPSGADFYIFEGSDW